MTHPLANDQTIPAIMRRAFSMVTCQIVRSYDDGSESVINMVSRAQAEKELLKHRAYIGHTMKSRPVVLVGVEIRSI